MVWSLFIIDLMGLFFYNKNGSIISIGDLPTTNIIEPYFLVLIYDALLIVLQTQRQSYPTVDWQLQKAKDLDGLDLVA